MTTRRVLIALSVVAGIVLLVVLIASPWDSGDDAGDTTSSSATSTSVAESTTTSSTSSTTTTSTTSTTTSTSSTTTTIAAVTGLDMSAEGLGEALFGADADGVVAYVNSIIGAPTSDTGWIDAASAGAACPGTEVRFVTWHDLSLFFTDDSFAASGSRHFASYTYGPAFGSVIDPFGITTDAGAGIGTTVEQLQATYPDGVLNAGDELFGPTFSVQDGLFAFLTDATTSGVATSWLGGFGCGE